MDRTGTRLEGPDGSTANFRLTTRVQWLGEAPAAVARRDPRGEMCFRGHLGRKPRVIGKDGTSTNVDAPQIRVLLNASILM